MSQILTILNEIAATSSTNEKQAIIERNKDNKLFRDVLYLAESPTEVYYLAKIPPRVQSSDMDMTIDNGLAILRQMSNRSISGTSAIAVLQDILSSMSADDAEVVGRVLLKDLRCGIGGTLINKAIPNHIQTFGYMGCKPYSKEAVVKLFKKNDYLISEKKADGRYVNIIIVNDDCSMLSRQGKKSFFNNKTLIGEAKQIADCFYNEYGSGGIVLNGELVMNPTLGLSRYTANGIIASVVDITEKLGDGVNCDKAIDKLRKEKGMTFDEAIDNIEVTVWDYIPYEIYKVDGTFNVRRIDRLNKLNTIINATNTTKVRMIEHKIVMSYEEAMSHFRELLSRGEEGTILKSPDNVWSDGKPSTQLKLKMEIFVDLEIVGMNEGTGKYVGMLGSLICKSSDGLLNVDPSAFSDEERVELWNNKENYIGKICEVKANGLSHNVSGEYSLMHPVFKFIRTDKTVADTLEEIKQNQNMVLGLGEEI